MFLSIDTQECGPKTSDHNRLTKHDYKGSQERKWKNPVIVESGSYHRSPKFSNVQFASCKILIKQPASGDLTWVYSPIRMSSGNARTQCTSAKPSQKKVAILFRLVIIVLATLPFPVGNVQLTALPFDYFRFLWVYFSLSRVDTPAVCVRSPVSGTFPSLAEKV